MVTIPMPNRITALVSFALLTGLTLAAGTHAADEPTGKAESSNRRPEVVENSIGMRFVRIPPGEFLMGSPESEPFRFDCEQQHRVRITKEYWLGIEEVTNSQYREVIGGTPTIDFYKDGSARGISWYEAEEFCRKLSDLDAEREAGRTYRLPTEAEWEYACRAGTQTMYSWGNEPAIAGDYAWYLRNHPKNIPRVGSRKPNPWGLYDMHGSGWEWCSDWFASFTAEDQVDPKGPQKGEEKVLKGGSNNNTESYLRCATRIPYEPIFSLGNNGQTIGMRVVLVQASEPPKE